MTPTGILPRRTIIAAAVVTALVATTLLALGTRPLSAQENPPPIASVPLTGRHEFTDDVGALVRLKAEGRARKSVNLRDASRLAVVEITVQPGARFPWHTHPGPVLVAVTQGTLDYAYADDCERRPYPTGTAFVDPGNSVHTAFNPSDDTETVVIATFLRAPEQGPVTLPVDAQKATFLDAKCGFAPALQAH